MCVPEVNTMMDPELSHCEHVGFKVGVSTVYRSTNRSIKNNEKYTYNLTVQKPDEQDKIK